MQKLTKSEFRVAQMAASGLRNIEIAQRLNTAPQTVKNQLRSVYDKVGCNNRVELTRWILYKALNGNGTAARIPQHELT